MTVSEKFFLLFLTCLLSACASEQNFMNFGGFPIKGLASNGFEPMFSVHCSDSDCIERFPLSPSLRIIFSAVWYLILFAIFCTVPLYFLKCFENIAFYLAYKKFWFVGSLLFPALFTMLTGIAIPANWYLYDDLGINYEVIFYIILIIIASKIIWWLTVFPATLQNRS